MKFFIDTANLAQIKEANDLGILDGVTTNPSHLAKAGGNPTQVVKEICALLPDGEISVEITEQDPGPSLRMLFLIAGIGPGASIE